MTTLPPIPVDYRSPDERFRNRPDGFDATVGDFWAWTASDLASDVDLIPSLV